MSPVLLFGSVAMLLLIDPLLCGSPSQDNVSPGLPYPSGSDITFQWKYSCPSSRGCSFNCPGSGSASHATKLIVYLGSMRVADRRALALFYEYSTREVVRGSGFSIDSGLGTLSCQINGMTLDYSGPPRSNFQD